MAIVIAVVLGLILGSFMSVLVGRWETKKGIIAGRSECPECRHVLAWYDLIPLASWLMLRGRCRYCDVPISVKYPLMELAMAGTLGIYAWQYGLSTFWALSDILILFGLVALFFFDLRWHLLPDAVVFPLIGIVVIRLLWLRPDLVANGLATGAGIAALLGLLWLVSHGGWLGLGDVKFAFLIGLLFGYPGAVGVTLVAIWAGALFGVGLMAAHRATLKTALPFGSFWSAVAVITVLWPAPVFYLSGLFTPVLR
ncbi:MAG TPA: prepilin peptidase [Candidatus Paceibacterota bacterium]|nr:prepilin peptidase [Candidatus Paceibacterota bacterium]